MSEHNDGGTAFPLPIIIAGPVEPDELQRFAKAVDCRGMSLRDWFAGQVLIGWALHVQNVPNGTLPGMAREMYAIADAMLAARAQERTT